jgi:hypothetical protein
VGELEGCRGNFLDPIDSWQHITADLRQFHKGCEANLGRVERNLKDVIMSQI